MTDVSATNRSNNVQANRPTTRTAPRTTPPAEDIRAMGEAFRRARGGMPGQGDGGVGRQTGKGQTIGSRGERAPDAATFAGWRAADDRATLDRRDGERHLDQGFGGLSQPATVLVVVAAQAQPPHVDPAAFAQLLADLWTRENGRGPREVRVMFGSATWPATGARLVRSADGLLDVTVQMAPGTGEARIDGLEAALGEQGLAVGRVSTSESVDDA